MKKIVLKKTVVANLSSDGMNALQGGGCDWFTTGSGGSCPAMTCGGPTKEVICISGGYYATCPIPLPEVEITPPK